MQGIRRNRDAFDNNDDDDDIPNDNDSDDVDDDGINCPVCAVGLTGGMLR